MRLIDFGFSKLVEEGEPMFTACGSTLYIAPEVPSQIRGGDMEEEDNKMNGGIHL